MSNWKEYRVEDFADIIGGGTPSTKEPTYYKGSIPWITPKDLTNYTKKHISRGERNITEEGLKNSSAKLIPKNSILLTSRAPIGYLAIAQNEVCTNQGFKSLVVNPEIADSNFIYYLLKANIEFIKSQGSGTTFAEVSGTVVKNLIFSIPDLPTQIAISEILSSLDDKIELNNKINQELEALAQALFKYWFVDFEFPNEIGEPYKSSGGEMEDCEQGVIPKGWVFDRLEKFTSKSHTGGDAIKKTPIVGYDTGIRCARVSDLTNSKPVDKWGFCEVTDSIYNQYRLMKGDIIVARTATLGVNQFVNEDLDAVCNNGLIRLQFHNLDTAYFIYQAMQDYRYKVYIERISGDSSTRPNMKMQYLLDYQIIHPDTSTLQSFNNILKPIIQKTRELENENRSIVNLRDTILPKLLSGKLKVSESSAEKAM